MTGMFDWLPLMLVSSLVLLILTPTLSLVAIRQFGLIKSKNELTLAIVQIICFILIASLTLIVIRSFHADGILFLYGYVAILSVVTVGKAIYNRKKTRN